MKTLLVVALLALGSVSLLACGDDDDDGGDSGPTATSDGAAVAADDPYDYAPPTQSSGGSTSGGSASNGAAAEGLNVSAVDFRFNPEEIVVSAGEEVTVRFTNNGSIVHTFTIDDVVDSSVVESGMLASVSFTIDAAGTYQFYCAIHGAATMSGTLIVE